MFELSSCVFEGLYVLNLDLRTCSYTFTLTSNSSIFKMTVTTDSKAMWTISEVILTTTASNTVQVDWTSSGTKVSTTESNCICCHDNASYLKIKMCSSCSSPKYMYLERSILAVDTPQQHQNFPSSHHTLYPTGYLYKSPLCLHLEH